MNNHSTQPAAMDTRAAVAVIVLDTQQRVVDLNTLAHALLASSADQGVTHLLGQPLAEVLPPLGRLCCAGEAGAAAFHDVELLLAGGAQRYRARAVCVRVAATDPLPAAVAWRVELHDLVPVHSTAAGTNGADGPLLYDRWALPALLIPDSRYVQSRLSELAALKRVAEALNQAINPHEALQAGLEAVADLVELASGWLWMVSETGKATLLAAYQPPAILPLEPVAAQHSEPCDCLSRLLAGGLKRPMDLIRCTRLAQAGPECGGATQHVSVAIDAGGRAVSILNLVVPPGRSFGPPAERLFAAVSQQFGVAIERALLFERMNQALAREQRRANEAETLRQAGAAVAATLNPEETVVRVLEQLSRVVPYADACVHLLRGDYLEVVDGRYSTDFAQIHDLVLSITEDNAYSEVYQQRRPRILADDEAVRHRLPEVLHGTLCSWLGVPLIVKDQVIGMLSLASPQPAHFSDHHAYLVAAFADQVAIALEHARLFNEVQELATVDPLTGLYNRRHFFALAAQRFAHARRYQQHLAVIMLDVDNFKQINDTFNHAAGDQVLIKLADHCRTCMRTTDILGRYGGEEFVILLPEANLRCAAIAAERLRSYVQAQRLTLTTEPFSITISLGVAALAPTAEPVDLEVLLDRADQALLCAKQSGKNRVIVWRAHDADVRMLG